MRLAWLSLLEVGCDELRVEVILGKQEVQHTTVYISCTCTHDEAFARGKSHRGIDALTIEDRCHGSTTADMCRDDTAVP